MVAFDAALKSEYARLYATCTVKAAWLSVVDRVVRKIAANRTRYEAIAAKIGCPWFLVGVVHAMESGLRFDRHLHNGDPLTAKTTHVPAGRPPGNPPFTFEDSAVDALTLRKWQGWNDWTLPGILWQLEGYNGFGYRQYHPSVKSPYLWSMTNQYVKGKYVSDGKFDPNAVSMQVGAAALLKRAQTLCVYIV